MVESRSTPTPMPSTSTPAPAPLIAAPAAPGPSEDPNKAGQQKRKGWPSDHPTRIAQREAREAAILAAGGTIKPRRIQKRKDPKKELATALDDELLGLAGDITGSSPMAGPSEVIDEVDDVDDVDVDESGLDPLDPEYIVRPCGLTRTELMRRIEVNDIAGLTENDVKAVQDEMWARKKDMAGGAPTNKNGKVRKKPGPAKGWKVLRGVDDRRSSNAGDWESETGTSLADENEDADMEIAALLDEEPGSSRKGKGKSRRPKLDHEDSTRYDSDEELIDDVDPEYDERRGSIAGSTAGTGKSKFIRPTKSEKDMRTKAEAIAVQNILGEHSEFGEIELPPEQILANNSSVLAGIGRPNMDDLRGVSENEAKVRFALVEDLQKVAWANIVKDIPKVCRVWFWIRGQS